MKINGEKLTNHTYMCFGAGTAGAGITDRIFREMVAQGLSEKEARKHFYMVDKQGLLFDDMDDLTPEQKPFARARSEFDNPEKLNNLTAAVMAVRPTILVGTSTAPKTFTKEIVKAMASWCDHPIIFPLSNPTELAEATAEDIIKWSDGRAMVATGIPAEPVEYNGVTYIIGQANNALIYPGLGLGSISVNASLVTDEMISSAAHSLGEFLEINVEGAAVLPPVRQKHGAPRQIPHHPRLDDPRTCRQHGRHLEEMSACMGRSRERICFGTVRRSHRVQFRKNGYGRAFLPAIDASLHTGESKSRLRRKS